MNRLLFKILLLVCSCGMAGPMAQGSQVNWLSRPFSSHQTSDGQPLDESFVFELGAFRDGFEPTQLNIAQWADHWTVAARSTFNTTNQVFGGKHTATSNAAPFSTTDRGYIWGFSIGETKEWILISDPSWVWPETGNPLAFPEDWSVSTASNIVVGQVDPAETEFFLQTDRIAGNSASPRITGDQWLVARFTPEQLGDPAVSGWDADPDGDGIPNMYEFALNTDPNVVDQVNNPLVEVVDVGGRSFFQVTFVKDPSVTLTYTVETSTGSGNWTSGPLETETLVDTPTLLIVRDRVSIDFVNRRFIRLTFGLED